LPLAILGHLEVAMGERIRPETSSLILGCTLTVRAIVDAGTPPRRNAITGFRTELTMNITAESTHILRAAVVQLDGELILAAEHLEELVGRDLHLERCCVPGDASLDGFLFLVVLPDRLEPRPSDARARPRVAARSSGTQQ
jgi:hypothetical protein